MTVYILDSDHATRHQREDPAVMQRLATVLSDQVFVTIVIVEEQMRGWLALIRRAQTPERLIPAYASLHRAVAYFARINILDYDEAAANHFAVLRGQKIRIGTQDLRIAAVALAASGVLVTRNRSDFQQVPGLVPDDWSQPLPPL
jgi:tRNA(fMet)-specific endonuclease VapC